MRAGTNSVCRVREANQFNCGDRLAEIGGKGIPSSYPLFLAALLYAAVPVAAADGVLSVQELEAQKATWAAMLESPLKVEGRVGGVSRFQFRFVHCEVTFRVTEEQSRTVGKVRNAEVSGRFKKDKETGKLFFAVDRVKVLGSDLEQFESREAKLKSRKAVDWNELADWAESRGKFYQDDELVAKARRARSKGWQFERTNLAANDFAGRLELAEKLRTVELDPELQAELLHEAARIQWHDAQQNGALNLFAAWMKKTYPTCSQPIEEFPRDLARRYEEKPLETFQKAAEAEREVIARLLFLKVESARILAGAKSDGSNAAQIAEELAARVPERSDLIDKHREAGFQWRLKSIASASRPEALRLADDLKARDKSEEATKLLGGWVRAQESRLKKDDPIVLMQLAEDYLQLAQDEPSAVKQLAAAHELDPSLSDAADRLKQLGYRLSDKQWIKGDAPDTATPNKVPSQLAEGMTAEAVLQLLGEPTGKTRVMHSRGTQEVWSFGRRGAPRLLIHLNHPAGQAARVTKYLTEN